MPTNWHFTTVDNPGQGPHVPQTSYLRSINDSGTMLGGNFYGTAPHGIGTFVGKPGSFTELTQDQPSLPGQIANNGTLAFTQVREGDPNNPFTYDGTDHAVPVDGGTATGINNHGDVVGYVYGSTGAHGFLDRHGHVSTFSYPGASSTFPEAINDGGRIVGYYTASDGNQHGFYGHKGNLHELDVRGAVSTELLGVNALGDMVGSFTDQAGKTHGFLDHGGQFTKLDAPGATSTTAYGINDSGEIVGGYLKGGIEHGFTANAGHWST
jgi:probable HAF family extracellular repeat protein